MFGFLNMMDNYAERKVARWPDTEDWIVDTAAVSDSAQPFETAVRHPRYNSGSMVIVELYDTKEEAQSGHDKWIATMSAKKLPLHLKDVSTCDIIDLGKALGTDLRETHHIDVPTKET